MGKFKIAHLDILFDVLACSNLGSMFQVRYFNGYLEYESCGRKPASILTTCISSSRVVVSTLAPSVPAFRVT